MGIDTLKSRSDFLAVRGGLRASVPSCLIEAKVRPEGRTPFLGPRFGLTVTKKLGNAVKRNRIRRRLKAAIAAAYPRRAIDGCDYVVVARAAAFDRVFTDIVADISRALDLIHKSPQGKHREPRGVDKRPQQVKKPPGRAPGVSG